MKLNFDFSQRPAVWLLFAGALLFSIPASADDCAPLQHEFYHTQKTRIVNARNETLWLRGISFGNEVWGDIRIPSNHHDESDFNRVCAMGMNAIRFYLNYKTLEDDAKPYTYLDDGWQWIDLNIEWARKQNLYLILNIHIPQGGFQSLGEGRELWEQPDFQKRLVSLWQAIARRYRDEPVVFGYDLLNEPGVTRNKQQWQQLAQQIIDAVRQVDARHPVIVERVNSVNRDWSYDEDLNFVEVKDDNLIYTFHIYDPFEYTHQLFPWLDITRDNPVGAWPNPDKNYTRDYLDQRIKQYSDWAAARQVPLYLGEWGLYKANFEQGRGGINYVKDMLAIIDKYQLSHTYHVYHEEYFGMFRGGGPVDPHNVNQALYDTLSAVHKP